MVLLKQFLRRANELIGSDRNGFDVVFFKDGGKYERYSGPLLIDGLIDGRVWGFRDITVSEKAVAFLQEREDRYDGIFDSAIDGFIILNAAGEIKEVNRALSSMHRWSEY